MDQSTRKLITMHNVLFSRDDVERLFHQKRMEEVILPTLKTALMHR